MSTLVERIKNHVFEHFKNEHSGHDHFHIERVFNMSNYLQSKEGGDLEVIQLTALLHDISDHKLNGGKLNDGGRASARLLEDYNADKELIKRVPSLIDLISFKGAHVKDEMPSLEGQIVQDADRLDAIGAIGIARAFAFGGSRNRPMFDPEIPAVMHESFESYAKSEGHTINHFYEKLLLLKDRLNTPTARQIGEERHQFMINYLQQFKQEWGLL